MGDLTFKIPNKGRGAFKTGEVVEVVDRDLKVIGTQKIVSVGLQLAKTECGRKWRMYDGWRWAENKAWPFPSIRHARS
jgi:hypothetical protein